MTQFEAERPRLLGVLLGAVVEGIQRLPNTRLEKLPRMADFALLAAASETAFWSAGTFMSAYAENRDDAVDDVIAADPVAEAVRTMMEAKASQWRGTATELLDLLTARVGERVSRAKSWPETPRSLGNRLRRAATALRKIGIDIEFGREKERERTRTVVITVQSGGPDVSPSEPSATSEVPPGMRVCDRVCLSGSEEEATFAGP
jgi:hypothetical protein